MPDVRVLHVHSGNMLGGVETVLLTLAQFRHLAPGLEQHYALSFEGDLSAALAREGVPVWQLGAVRTSRPWTVRRGRRTLRDLTAEVDAHVVVCHGPWPQAVFGPAARAAGRPLVFWQHGALTGHHWLERLARRTPPDLSICNSRFSQGSLPTVYPDVESTVIYCPVAAPDASALRPRADTRRDLGTHPDRPVVIQVSRMEPGKGQRLLLAGLSRIRETEWECWVVGGAQRRKEEAYQRELEREAAKLGIADRVRFLGRRDDVRDLLAAANLYCQPNTGLEAFGITFVEALYAGLPVVATRMGGAEEIVTPSCGVLVSPGDVQGLATVLRELIDDPERRSALARAAPARAAELCDPATQTARFQEAIITLARAQ